MQRWQGSQRRIGITGGIASGKSTVARYLHEKKNLVVLDADHYAKEALSAGNDATNKVTQRYGKKIIEKKDGNEIINRKKLAEIIVETIHGKDGLSDALRITDYFFKEKYNDLSLSDLDDLMQNFPSSEVSMELINSEMQIGKLLVENNIFKSMGEMRRMSNQGALYINGERITEISRNISDSDLIKKKIMIIKKGSKEFFILKFS